MANIQLISDSSCDLHNDIVSEKDIKVVPFSVTLDDGKTYLRENEEITVEDFYRKLSEKEIFPKTSLPSVKQYLDVFKESVDKGNDVVCICISSKFSGSYQSAVNAMEILKDESPKGKIVVIDSYQATIAQGSLVLFAKELIEKGYDVEEIEKILVENRNNCKTYLTVSSLEYLQKGGRLGKGAALVGTILNINPILLLDNGELHPVSKVRGRKKALTVVCESTKKYIMDNNLEDYKISLVYADIDKESAEGILREVVGSEVAIEYGKIGVTIGAHTGGTCVGVVISYYKLP